MVAQYSVAHATKAGSEPFPIPPSDGVQYNRMGDLETAEMRIRLWFFEPGRSGSFHTHHVQAEVYFVVAGDAWARLGHDDDEEEAVELPAGSALKVPTGVPREIGTPGDDEVWILAVSAPNQMEGGRPGRRAGGVPAAPGVVPARVAGNRRPALTPGGR